MTKIFDITQVGEVLQKIYDSEINLEMSWFWDGGIDYRIGDKVNGYPKINEILLYSIKEERSMAHMVSVIAYKASVIYPDSGFAIWYKTISQ